MLFGWDDIKAAEEIIIVEGEIDKLSLEEAGFRHVASVPDGAPGSVKEGRLPAPQDDKKYSYIWNRCLPISEPPHTCRTHHPPNVAILNAQ